MFIEEPYAERPLSGAVPVDVPEIRVPAGYVFVMGDNRAIGEGGDRWVQGLVPVTHLIGRVTDVAISRHVLRMGRWIGTPSN
jgi:hypothetical protein